MFDAQQIQNYWQTVCQTLAHEIPTVTYQTLIAPHQLTSIQASPQNNGFIAVITFPSSFHALKFENSLGNRVRQLLTEQLGQPTEINSQIKPRTISPHDNRRQSRSSSNLPSNNLATPTSLAEVAATADTPLFSEALIAQNQAKQAASLARSAGLREDFTFDTFAVSTSNEMAHAAAQAVAARPGVNYNPLFFYGGVGVGKTHLMHAIGNQILRDNPSTKIIYCTGEEFLNEIIQGVQNKKMAAFKERFRQCQVLMIDDIQFIAGKTTAQEEFFHTFNALTKKFSQVILTSDRPPQEIALLEDRIRSRFEAGLIVDIQQPSFELRTAILMIKAQASNLHLDIDLARIIADRLDSARKIEGMIKKLRSEVELKKSFLDRPLIENLLSEEAAVQRRILRLNPSDILSAVAKHTNIKPATIRGQKRTKEVVTARHIAMYLFKTELQMSYVEIGKWFASRDHTSAMHAIKKINSQLNTDDQLQQEVATIRNFLAGSAGS